MTGALGEIFGAVQAVQIARAERGVVDHFRRLGEIVKVTNYVLDRANLPVLVEVRRAILGDLRPASTAVVAGLARAELLVEVDAIVALTGGRAV